MASHRHRPRCIDASSAVRLPGAGPCTPALAPIVVNTANPPESSAISPVAVIAASSNSGAAANRAL